MVLGVLVALPVTVAAPAGADSTALAPAQVAPTRVAPNATSRKAPKQSPKPGSMGRARPALVLGPLKYDSLLSVNEQCPIRGGKLNPGIRPMYVNRKPVGFC
jgi:hypothetical protein